MSHTNDSVVAPDVSSSAASTPESIWQAVLGELELSISKANFTTWFKSTSILRYERGEAVILVPNMFTRNWLQNKYHKDISKALQNVTGERITKISYELHSQAEAVEEQHKKMEEEKLREEQSTRASIPVPVATMRTPIGSPSIPNATTALNSKYSFENLVVGANNELAIAAARAVTKNPGTMYNPLFIYGGVGLGKTHLIQS
ncbi:MAG: hypothetical protein KC653_01655, partial [Candidatus Andersenbacteria bacterium]|nr:hypothetical protein [Candidatus Andersenbacteria bacterium]